MSEQTASAKAKSKIKAAATAAEKRLSPRRSEDKTIKPSLNLRELRELAELVDQHGFTDFEFENENIRVRLSKMITSPIVHAAAAVQPTESAAVPQSAAQPSSSSNDQIEVSAAAASKSADENLHTITSPIVGTFYRSPSPDKDSYVKEGSAVSPETIVCIVEAMKLMNEIQAETSGEIVKIYVENGQPVEFGQPLSELKSKEFSREQTQKPRKSER